MEAGKGNRRGQLTSWEGTRTGDLMSRICTREGAGTSGWHSSTTRTCLPHDVIISITKVRHAYVLACVF